MIKTEHINEINVYPFWNEKKKTRKTVKKNHFEITPEPFPNIILCGRKKSGKTTTALYLIFRFMTNKTKLIIFSPDLLNDRENSSAVEMLKEIFGEESIIVHKAFFNAEGKNIFLDEINDADDRFKLEKENTKSKYLYPSTIFFFDDLSKDELKSQEIGTLSQNNRHYGCLNIYSSQDWKNFDVKTRNNIDMLFLWNGLNKERLKSIYDQIQPPITYDNFLKMYNKSTDGKNFLYYNFTTREFRKNLSEQLYIG